MNKKDLSERDICSKFIGPAVKRAGWDGMMQIREEVAFTKGRIIVRGKLVTRGKAKRADYILYYKPNIPIAIIEAKDNNHSVGDGMQQALDYAVTLNIPFVFSSNGDGFVFHDRTGASPEKEASLSLDAFPTPKELWAKYRAWKGLTPDEEEIVLQDYFDDGSGKAPRYYQTNAINASIEAIAKGQNRVLLVMATGTGKRKQPNPSIFQQPASGQCSPEAEVALSPTRWGCDGRLFLRYRNAREAVRMTILYYLIDLRFVELSLFRAVAAQGYLLILRGLARTSCLFLSFLLEPKWSQAKLYKSACRDLPQFRHTFLHGTQHFSRS